MKLKMLTSLGTADAKLLGVDHESAREGAVIDAPKDAAEILLKRGWATDPGPETLKADPPKATKIEGVPATGKPANG